MPRLGFTAAQFTDVCAAIFDMADELPADDLELRQRLITDVADGYPTQSLGGGGGATNELDDDGTPIPQHSDPVGNLVANQDEKADPLIEAGRRAWSHVRNAMRELEAARSIFASTHPPVDASDLEHDRGLCWSCRRAGIKNTAIHRDSALTDRDTGEPRGANEPRCRNCYDWALAHAGVNPPRLVVETWGDGRKLTTKIVDAAMREERERRQRKKSKKRKR